MLSRRWRGWLRLLGASATRSRRVARLRNCRPHLEALEDRLLPAVYTVNSTADEPDGDLTDHVADTGYIDRQTGEDHHTKVTTLRAAIEQANAEGVAATIHFAIGDGGVQTIVVADLP